MSMRAGVSAKEITPQEKPLLAGYGGEEKRIVTGVRDPLYVSAVHLRTGPGGVIIISLDLFSINPSTVRAIKAGIYEATGTPENQVFVGTTRTHSAPCTGKTGLLWQVESGARNEEYLQYIVDQSIQAASESAVASRPAAIATVSMESPNCGVLFVKDTFTSRISALIIVGKRVPDLLGPQNTEISSDFIGPLREKLARRFTRAPVVVYFTAPSDVTESQNTGQGEESIVSAGNSLAHDIVEKVKAMRAEDFRTDSIINGKISRIDLLPRRKDPASEPGKLVMPQERSYLESVIEEYAEIDVQMMRLGDIRLLGMPARIESACGCAIAEEIGAKMWIAQYVNGDLAGGILGVADDSNCELVSQYFEPRAGQLLAEAATELGRKSCFEQ